MSRQNRALSHLAIRIKGFIPYKFSINTLNTETNDAPAISRGFRYSLEKLKLRKRAGADDVPQKDPCGLRFKSPAYW